MVGRRECGCEINAYHSEDSCKLGREEAVRRNDQEEKHQREVFKWMQRHSDGWES